MLDAGSVVATLGGVFQPSGFVAFDGAMKKSAASAAAAEKQIAGSQKRTGAAVTAMGTAATAAAAVVVVGLVKSAQAAQRFEKQMSELQAVTKAGAKQMDVMKAAALDLGAKTGVGATQAARALTELAKGGMSAKQSTDALVGTIALAQAGNMDLADAATTVVQSLATFNLRAGDATRVADGLASAANRTTMDVGDFAQAFAQGGSAAQAAGLSFDQTLNVLGAMANRFRSGSDMGTSLKTTLIQLAHPTKKAQAEMNRLNIDLFDAEGRFRSAAEVTKQLGDRFADMSPKQRLASAAIIAGTDGMRTLIALSQGSGGAIREQGAAADTAAAKMDNLSGSWSKLKGEAETAAIGIGEELTPALKDAADAAADFIRGARTGQGAGGFFADLAKGAGKLVELNWDALGEGVKSGKYLLDFLRGVDRSPKQVKVTARIADQVTPTLVRIAGTKLAPKVQRILGNDASVQAKIRALRGLGINGPTARFLAQTGSVEAAISAVGSRSVTIPVNFKAQPFSAKPPGSASGRGAGTAGVSLVGEGGGPEAVGNPRDGFRMTTGPGLAALGADDYVIPTEPKYRGRALALMADALGIPGFAGGKGAKRKPKRKPRPIPKSVYLGHSVEYFDSEVQHLEQVAGDRDKKNKLTAKAKRARKQLAEMKRVQKQARSYDARVKKHEDEANIQRDNMQAADSRDDVKGYKAAWKNRKGSLTRARVLLRGALKFAPPSSKYHQDIRARIAGINALLDDMTGDKAGSPLEAKDVDATTFTTGEQERLDRIDADIALAALTAPTTDDLAAQRAREGFLAPLLAAVQASGGAGRGGSSAITDIAGDLKTTRDTIAELTKAPDITADQTATAEQSYQRGLAEGKGSSIDRLVGAATGSPITVNYNALTASPRDAQKATETIVAGIGYQGGRPRSSTRVAA